MKLYALLGSQWELLFTEAAVADDGTIVRRVVTRPSHGSGDSAGLAWGPGSFGAPAPRYVFGPFHPPSGDAPPPARPVGCPRSGPLIHGARPSLLSAARERCAVGPIRDAGLAP